MKRACAFSFVLSYAALLPAQNLVPNGNFEEYSECPDYLVQVERCVGWDRAAYTPDYFNACDTQAVVGNSSWVGVPYNFVGYQSASNGNGYMGMITYLDSSYAPDPELLHEHIGAYLTEPLIPGATVYLSFRASATYGNGFNDRPKYVSSRLGVRFRNGPMDLFNPEVTDNSAALSLEDVLLDSSGWVLVRGSYVPDSAYDYIVVGNFFDRFHCQPVLVNPDGNTGVAYAYVDDLCVSYDSTAYLNTGFDEPNVRFGLPVYPNPCSTDCRVIVSGLFKSEGHVTLYGADGRDVLRRHLISGMADVYLSTKDLQNGVYWIRLESDEHHLTTCIIVQH